MSKLLRNATVFNVARGATIEDFLYLPSHLTKQRKEEMTRKFGSLFKIDRNVSQYFLIFILKFEGMMGKLSSDFDYWMWESYPNLVPVLHDLEDGVDPLIRMAQGMEEKLREMQLQQAFENQKNASTRKSTDLSKQSSKYESRSAVEQQKDLEQQVKMKKALAIIELFRPKNARLALKRSAERDSIELQHQQDKLVEEAKKNAETMTQQREHIERLKFDIKKVQEEKETLRKNYFKELMVYRNADTAKKTKQAGGVVEAEDRISVAFFDGLEGLDPEVVEILNQKIKSVKAQAELTIARLTKSNAELA